MPKDNPFPAAVLLTERYQGHGPTVPPQVNSVVEHLLNHRSVRAYLPDALPEGALETALVAAQSAASSSNLQVWSVIAVKDKERKARLAAVTGNQKHILDAPLLLVWLADLSRLGRIAEARGLGSEGLDYTEMLLVGVVDAALAAQNAVVALESLGLGTVYIGALRNDITTVAKELGLPPHVMPVFGLVVGKPDPARPTAIKPRLPLNTILSHEQYSSANEAEAVEAYDALFKDFQRSQSLPEEGWVARSAERVGTPKALTGRHVMKEAIIGLGFKLK
ncbi:NADPH-dependent oxidoreductase [Rhodovarius lipocyclicus]|uniref:NADPH-dependent oxidoreductase n=1 Tax=Rhodovarius lipocyclicus TaxID=268410 RepID=UPI00135C2510|nr:NADPH-dependent oxidoreductase [Rhodovarius lipocyclicus]